MNDPLLGNKIAAAILTALLLFFGLPQLVDKLVGGGHHGGHSEELHLAYPIDYQTQSGGGGEEVKEVISLGTLLASANAKGGERRAALCKSCHTFDEGGAQSTGPNLWNIVNRPLASVDGFNYTNAIKEAGGVWSYERLDAYIKNSQKFIPGTAMNQRFPKDAQRADILAYLATLSADPVPFPAADAPAPETEAEGAQ